MINKPIFLKLKIKTNTEESLKILTQIDEKIKESKNLGISVDISDLEKELTESYDYKESRVNVEMIVGYYHDFDSVTGSCIETVSKNICTNSTVEEIDKMIENLYILPV